VISDIWLYLVVYIAQISVPGMNYSIVFGFASRVINELSQILGGRCYITLSLLLLQKSRPINFRHGLSANYINRISQVTIANASFSLQRDTLFALSFLRVSVQVAAPFASQVCSCLRFNYMVDGRFKRPLTSYVKCVTGKLRLLHLSYAPEPPPVVASVQHT